MVKKQTSLIAIIFIVGVLFFFVRTEGEIITQSAASTDTAKVSRVLSSNTVTPNSEVQVTLIATGMGVGEWFVGFQETPPNSEVIEAFMYDAGVAVDTFEYTITAPSNEGTYVFSGWYHFTGSTQKTIVGEQVLTVQTCNTLADTNCNGLVSFDELIIHANKWLAGQVTFSDLIQVANEWVSTT